MKLFKNNILLLTFLFSICAQAQTAKRITDGKDHLKLSGKKIVVVLDKGFHFVMASPAGLYLDGEIGSEAPTKKNENQMVFDVSKVKDQSFTVSFYVCDDQKTVCESHEAHLEIQKGKLINLAKPTK